MEASDAPCTYIPRLHYTGTPSEVQGDGRALSRLDLPALQEAAAGWSMDGNLVTVKARSRQFQIR